MSHDADAIHEFDHVIYLSILQILHILDELLLSLLILLFFLHLRFSYRLKTAFNLVSNFCLDPCSQVLSRSQSSLHWDYLLDHVSRKCIL